jgi:hypothetical protein
METKFAFTNFAKAAKNYGARDMFAVARSLFTFRSPRHDFEIAMLVYTTHNEPNYLRTRKTRQSVEQIWNMTAG